MSDSGVLQALATGPKSTAELLRVTGTSSGDVARTCAGLRHAGKIKRIDGSSGRGSRAIYALVDDTRRVTALPPRSRGPASSARNEPPVPGVIVDRDPCFMCGVRGDLGCRHKEAA